jgi:soluble lytic murein transglycosylase-like protein
LLTRRTYSVPVLLVSLAVPAAALAAPHGSEAPQRIGLSAAQPAGPATLTRPVRRFHRAIRLSVRRARVARRAHRAELRRERQQAFAALPGGVSQATLDAIGACESGGDPTAVSSDGSYRGKYQFDQGTWESVGGSGDPAAAPEAEQDYRAALLYSQAGSSPWPVCG